jgi:suppressor of ftsI
MFRRLAFVAVVGALVACAGPNAGPNIPSFAQTAHSSQALPDQAQALPEPPVVRAVNGVARVALFVVNNPNTGQPGFRYRGVIGDAPTIEVEPGESVDVELHNHLSTHIPPAESMDAMGMAKTYENDVNLHFHGLGSSPQRPGDDVLTMIADPGHSLHYVIRVPANQEPGLYWYHAHVHGVVNYQVGESGLSGALIVDGLERHIPALGKMKQRLLIVRSTGFDGDALPNNTNTAPCATKDHLTTTINGVLHPVITIAPGEQQFFRLVNATGHKTLALNVTGEAMQLVAVDGFALDTYPGTPTSEAKRTIVVPPAARAEFVVTGPAAGHGVLRTLCYDTGPNGDPDPEMTLAYLKSAPGSRSVRRKRLPIEAGEPLPRNVYTTQLPAPSQKRLVIFSEDAKPHFYINGRRFEANAKPMFVVHTRTTEEWEIDNVTHEIHDFHIHQIHFVVESINGVALRHPYWADSVVLPHRHLLNGKSVPGSLMLLMDFRDPVIRGMFVFHCHILDHEDEGMMAKIEAI